MPIDSPDQVIKTNYLTQDMFPGAYLEPKWSQIDKIKNCPFYTMRLLLGASVVMNPGGKSNNVSMILEGSEYVLDIDNYNLCVALRDHAYKSYFAANGFVKDRDNIALSLVSGSDLGVKVMQFLVEQAILMFDVVFEKTRMIFIQPDLGACGDYRCFKPFQFTKNLENFHTEYIEYVNLTSLHWYDAFMMHRFPPGPMISAFQSLKEAGKFLVYEFDDDIFNVPEWNFNTKKINKEHLERARTAIEMADLVIGSTEELLEVSGRPEVAMHGPNLIDFNSIPEPLQCDRIVQTQWKGYYPVRVHKNNVEYRHKTLPTRIAINESEYNPVRILWTGSNTHDEDVKIIISAVKQIGKEYGIAVRFVFFGYCPGEFLEAVTDSGNTNRRLQVKDEFCHYIDFIEAVPYKDYLRVIKQVDPDFALCPLSDNVFNLSKSNLKILELGALGIPIIASSFGPYKETITDNIDGVLCDNNAWHDSINCLLKDSIFRIDLGAALRKTVTEKYSWNNLESDNVKKWELIFNKIHEGAQVKKQKLLDQILQVEIVDKTEYGELSSSNRV